MQLNDTEKEGDGERCIMNWKLLMLYFRSRSRGKKYAFEAMRLPVITSVKALYTEKSLFKSLMDNLLMSEVVQETTMPMT